MRNEQMNYNKALPWLFQKIYTVLRCRLILDSKTGAAVKCSQLKVSCLSWLCWIQVVGQGFPYFPNILLSSFYLL